MCARISTFRASQLTSSFARIIWAGSLSTSFTNRFLKRKTSIFIYIKNKFQKEDEFNYIVISFLNPSCQRTGSAWQVTLYIYQSTFPPSPSFIPSFEAKYTEVSENDLTGTRRARRTSQAPGSLSDRNWTLEPDIPVSHTQTWDLQEEIHSK